MTTITIGRGVLVGLIEGQIKMLGPIDKAHGFDGPGPLTRYLTALLQRLQEAKVVVPVNDDLIHDYHLGEDFDTRISNLLRELKAAGQLTPATAMVAELREPA